MLRVNELRKTFGASTAVDGVSFNVAPGEVLGLLGPNGAGKSTTISMVAGLIAPDSGSVEINEATNGMGARQRLQLGVAPQSIALYEDLTCVENLSFFGALHGVNKRERSTRIADLLESVGLTDNASKRVTTLSGGMQRRLNLAASLIHQPKVILLDEPTAGVDPHSRNAILDLVAQLRDQGIAILYTTHYMEEAQRICDRVAIIDYGKILAIDTVDALIDQHGGDTLVRVQHADREHAVRTNDPRATVLELLADNQATGLRVDRPDLEAVFFSLTGRRLRD